MMTVWSWSFIKVKREERPDSRPIMEAEST